MLFTPFYLWTMVNEWGMWKKTYLPDAGVKDKTVLDVGAGCGETAHFYLSQGAKRVIAIEESPAAVELLRKNTKANNWNVEIVPHSFEVSQLEQFSFDFMKMDIEGGEVSLLDLPSIPPSVIETHGPAVTEVFIKKFQMKRVGGLGGGEIGILTNSRNRPL